MFQSREKINLNIKPRPEDPGDRRIAQLVKYLDFKNDENLEALQKGDVVIWGYPDDRGVERNYGRLGASEAPDEIRKQFYKLCLHKEKRVFDLGNFSAWSYSLEEAHQKAAAVVEKARKKGAQIITLGGGHDWAYPDFRTCNERVINVDAHLDLRPQPDDEERKNHSGTPFRRIIEERKDFRLGVMGLQRSANSLEHIKWAEGHRVQQIFMDELNSQKEALKYIEQYFQLGDEDFALSVDLDVFSQAYAPGVSAPAVSGMSPDLLFQFIRQYKSRIVQLGIYELCPRFDRDFQTARLAANILYEYLF